MPSDLSPVSTGLASFNVSGSLAVPLSCFHGLRLRATLCYSRAFILAHLSCFVKGFSKFVFEFVFALIVRHSSVSEQRGKILPLASSFVKGIFEIRRPISHGTFLIRWRLYG